jgi:tetratricopeptide (TPR) repeat protein
MKPLRILLVLGLLWTSCFVLAFYIQPWSETQQVQRKGGLLPLLLGDGRRLFANHFFAKADAYFHRGVYPSIFDAPRPEEMHMVTAGQETLEAMPEEGGASEVHDEHDNEEEHDPEHCDDPTHVHERGATPGGDWIAWLNGQLKPSAHAHLDGGDEREMLPWLMLATELDPNNAQTYITTAYWLRTRLGRVDEAEHLLRESMRQKPSDADPAILFELGVLILESRHDAEHARNVFVMALGQWERQESSQPEPDYPLKEAILARLALIDEVKGRLAEAIGWLRELEPISPQPESVHQHIDQLQSRLSSAPEP